MKYRTLAQTGVNLSAIGLGCMGMSFAYGPRNDEDSVAVLHRALDLGIYHAINPLTGVALSGSPVKILDATNVVEILDGTSANAPKGADIEV